MNDPINTLPPYRGGHRVIRRLAIAGAVCLLVTLIGFVVAPRTTLFSYFVGFSFTASISVGALCWLMAFHAANAKWPVLIARPLELMGGNGGLLALLFIPIAVGMRHLYPWVAPEASGRGEEFIALMHHKAAWLAPGWFVVRAVLCFAVFGVIGNLLIHWSHRSDDEGGVAWRLRMRRLSSVGLPLVGLSATFAAFDWIMSLEPAWYSTIFGLYWFAGGFVAADAVWILAVFTLDQAGPLRGRVRPSHYHSMGKLLFAFVCFWAYIAFSQLLLIWIGNLPQEIPYYAVRGRGGWRTVSMLLLFGHFVLPFLILLSRDLKRNPRALACVAGFVIVMHWVDSFWLVSPSLRGPAGTAWPHWQDLAATPGIVLIALAFALFRFEGRLPAPVRDPFFDESLLYNK